MYFFTLLSPEISFSQPQEAIFVFVIIITFVSVIFNLLIPKFISEQ